MKFMILAGVAIAASLAACSPQTTAGAGTAIQTASLSAEKAETAAELSYVGLATTLNALEAQPGASSATIAKDEALKLKAWKLLTQVRGLYAAGMDFTGVAAQLALAVTEAPSAPAAATAVAPH